MERYKQETDSLSAPNVTCLLGKGTPSTDKDNDIYVKSIVAASALIWYLSDKRPIIVSESLNCNKQRYPNEVEYSEYLKEQFAYFGILLDSSNCIIEDEAHDTYMELFMSGVRIRNMLKQGRVYQKANIEIIGFHNTKKALRTIFADQRLFDIWKNFSFKSKTPKEILSEKGSEIINLPPQIIFRILSAVNTAQLLQDNENASKTKMNQLKELSHEWLPLPLRRFYTSHNRRQGRISRIASSKAR